MQTYQLTRQPVNLLTCKLVNFSTCKLFNYANGQTP